MSKENSPKAMTAPVSEFWRAKRDLASVSRQLSEAIVTSNATVEELDQATGNIGTCLSELRRLKHLYGQQQFEAHAEDGERPDLTVELNALGGWCNPVAPGIDIWLEDDRAYGTVNCSWTYEGPPGSVHGGIIAAIFDHFLGKAQFVTGAFGVTAGLNVRYRKLVPLNVELHLEAWCEKQEGRKTFMKGVIKNDGQVLAEAEGIFIWPRGGIGLDSMDRFGQAVEG